MDKIKIGYLPLYLDLYDKASPQMRPRIEGFCARVKEKLSSEYDVTFYGICKLKNQFKEAVELFERENVSAIVTLHLSYSPSLECIDALKGTNLPIISLDTTETFDFGEDTDANEISYNHGIHGVQDMCNLLIRNGKKFAVAAGHFEKSDVFSKLNCAVRAAHMRKALSSMRVGLIGKPFDGMGDFSVPFDVLKKIGVEVVEYDFDKGDKISQSITESELKKERALDEQLFEAENGFFDTETYKLSAKVNLTVRKWLEENNLKGFSANFLESGKPGFLTMPFVECSKAMARGLGYAGEGDVLTAALVGALAAANKDVTFTEMFCPDWKGGSVFLSHMGEFNYNIAAFKPKLSEKPFPYTEAQNPAVAYAPFKPGKAVFVNLAPLKEGFRLIASKGEMLRAGRENKLSGAVNGWFKPEDSIESFLEKYSEKGGTHHAALIYDGNMKELEMFAKFAGFEFVEV